AQQMLQTVLRFEPFGEHTINASWVAVQELKKLGLGKDIDLHVYEVPVDYQATLPVDLFHRHFVTFFIAVSSSS
uniref:Pyroglutamyl-peptidase 1 n=1 Tax=Oncorhynchus mykiss TaxID=8022 RepID=A0A8K9Y6U5_ONCMY